MKKTLMLGKIEGKREKRATEDKMVGWHHQLNRHEFEQTPEGSVGQDNMACCGPWGHRVIDDLAPEQRATLE